MGSTIHDVCFSMESKDFAVHVWQQGRHDFDFHVTQDSWTVYNCPFMRRVIVDTSFFQKYNALNCLMNNMMSDPNKVQFQLVDVWAGQGFSFSTPPILSSRQSQSIILLIDGLVEKLI